jgi:hypothetical protein
MKHLNKINCCNDDDELKPASHKTVTIHTVSFGVNAVDTRVSSGNNGLEGFFKPFAVKDN